MSSLYLTLDVKSDMAENKIGNGDHIYSSNKLDLWRYSGALPSLHDLKFIQLVTDESSWDYEGNLTEILGQLPVNTIFPLFPQSTRFAAAPEDIRFSPSNPR